MTLRRDEEIVSLEVAERFAEHPAASLFPMLDDEKLREMAEDIRVNGLRNAVVLVREGDRKLVLDGRNRVRACRIAGVPVKFRMFEGGDPYAFVVSENLHRRHLDESQRAMVAARLATLRRGGVGGSHHPKGDASIEATHQTDAAKSLKVSRSSVQRARHVLESGDEALIAKVDAGEVSVHKASQLVRRPENVMAPPKSKPPEPRESTPFLTGDKAKTMAEVARLHSEGLRGVEIARRLDISREYVSKLKAQASAGTPDPKLWIEVRNIAEKIGGAASHFEKVAESIDTSQLVATEEEIRSCITTLKRTAAAIRLLYSALARKQT